MLVVSRHALACATVWNHQIGPKFSCSTTGKTIEDGFGTVAVLVLSNFKDSQRVERCKKKTWLNWLKFYFWPCWMAPVVNHWGSFVMRSEWEIWNLLTCKLRFSFPNTHTCSLNPPPPPQLSKPLTYMHSWTFTFGSICKSYSTSHNLNVKPLLFPNYTFFFFFFF